MRGVQTGCTSPPHFHTEKSGEWEIRVHFMLDDHEMFETIWTARKGRPSKGDLRELVAAVRDHRPQLLEEWQDKVNAERDG